MTTATPVSFQSSRISETELWTLWQALPEGFMISPSSPVLALEPVRKLAPSFQRRKRINHNYLDVHMHGGTCNRVPASLLEEAFS